MMIIKALNYLMLTTQLSNHNIDIRILLTIYISQVRRENNYHLNPYIKALATGPAAQIETYSGYFVNGCRFHTIDHDRGSATVNSGVCIKGSVYGSNMQDFYGRLLEVCVLDYPGYPKNETVLFRCEWFDLSSAGTSVDPDFNMVSINHTRRYRKYDPFVLASQVIQVFYCPYPSKNQSKKNWWAACRVKGRSNVEIPNEPSSSTLDEPFQEEDVIVAETHTNLDDDPIHVQHPQGGIVQIDDNDDVEDVDEDVNSSDDETSEGYDSDL